MFNSASPALWGGFLLGVIALLALDLGVFSRGHQVISTRKALVWSGIWIGLSLCFNVGVYLWLGRDAALEFLSAYIIEKSLSVDNVFVFVVILRFLKIPRAYLHRVLFAGIFGAIFLRALFIFAGLAIVEAFSWSLYLFGAFLIYTGIKILFLGEDDNGDVAEESLVRKIAQKCLRITEDYDKPVFWLRRDGKLWATPMLLALLMVETADVVFALDSIPAIFGISRNPFVVFSSNICAILGLRSLFFVLENLVDRFRYLQHGLGIILCFVGVKMILAEGLGALLFYHIGVEQQPLLEPFHVDTGVSLAIVGSILVGSVVASLVIGDPSGPPSSHND